MEKPGEAARSAGRSVNRAAPTRQGRVMIREGEEKQNSAKALQSYVQPSISMDENGSAM